MEKRDNYATQAAQAKAHFLTYDQKDLIRKLRISADEDYLYPVMLGFPYRICRRTGDLSRREGDTWVDGNSYDEVMTLLDLVCDSREDRSISGQWKDMKSFGLMFHRNLLEEQRNPTAESYDADPEGFIRACQALHGEKLPFGDIGYAVELFDGLKIAMVLWRGDEEFPPRLRYFWDENAREYIRYETMYFAVNLLRTVISRKMTENAAPQGTRHARSF